MQTRELQGTFRQPSRVPGMFSFLKIEMVMRMRMGIAGKFKAFGLVLVIIVLSPLLLTLQYTVWNSKA